MPKFEGLKKWRVPRSGGSAQEALRADRHDGGEDDWSKPLVCVKEHGAREPGDVRREQKTRRTCAAATQEPKRAAVATRVDELEQQLDTVSGGQRHQGVQRLFEAKESVPQDVEDSDGDCEAPQPPRRSVRLLTSFALIDDPFSRPSRMVYQPPGDS